MDAEAGIALGFRRLAIVDLSPAGSPADVLGGRPLRHRLQRRDLQLSPTCAPSSSATAGTVPRALRHRGAARGDRRAGASTAALSALRRHVRLRAVGPRASAALQLARDRLGEKPLYYGRHRRTLAVRLRAEGAARPSRVSRGEIDRDALALLLRLRLRPGARTRSTRGIASCRPAHECLTRRRGRCPTPVGRYWRAPSDADDAACGAAERIGRGAWPDALEALLRDAVARADGRRRAARRVPLRRHRLVAVVALMQAQSPRPVRTFTHRLPARATTTRRRYARAVAAHLGTEHTELYVTPGGGARRRSRAARRSTTSRSPTRRRSRPAWSPALARRHVTVASPATAATSCSAATTATRRAEPPVAAARADPAGRLRSAAAAMVRPVAGPQPGTRLRGRAAPVSAGRARHRRRRRQAAQAGAGCSRRATRRPVLPR